VRRDIRDWLVLSIDPKGSEDIDDALSVNELSNGRLQVGVRILKFPPPLFFNL